MKISLRTSQAARTLRLKVVDISFLKFLTGLFLPLEQSSSCPFGDRFARLYHCLSPDRALVPLGTILLDSTTASGRTELLSL